MGKNPIQELNEHCQKVGIALPSWNFTQVSITPSVWKAVVTLGEFSASGEEASKKSAQAAAANILALLLKDQEIWHDQLGKRQQKDFGREYIPKKVWQPH